MLYLSKLVKRIVLGRTLPVLLVMAAAACAPGEGTTGPAGAEDISEVVVEPNALRLREGEQFRLSARVLGRSGRTVAGNSLEWTSSDTTVAVVYSDGSVTALMTGTAEITAKTRGKSGKTRLTVSPDTTTTTTTTTSVSSVRIAPDSVAATVGDTVSLAATVLGSSGESLTGYAVSWASSNTSIATVDQSGRVVARASGSVTVTATSGGKSGMAAVAVQAESAPAPIPVATDTGAAAPFFIDDFESGARRSANGFTWSSTGSRVTVSSANAYSGNYALAFRYGADSLGGDSSAEQRFDMGRYLSEYWVDYMIFFPTNFEQRADSPNNNKFFMTWRDTYSDVAGGTWRVGYEYQGTSSLLRPMSSRWDYNSWTSSGLNHPAHNKPFIGGDGPIKLGQWTRIRLQFKAASSRTSTDGVMRIWVNDELFGELTTGKFHNYYDSPVDAVLRRGYFMGWANSGFTQETLIYIDNVKFYERNPGW